MPSARLGMRRADLCQLYLPSRATRKNCDSSTERLFCCAASSTALGVLKPLAAAVGLYAIVGGAVYFAQRKLQYFPFTDTPAHPAAVDPLWDDVKEVAIVAADGTRCLAWHWPAPAPGSEPYAPWWLGKGSTAVQRTMATLRQESPELQNLDVLLFHGNAGHRGHRLEWMHLVREGLGCSVTIIDYRGYGGSEGSPDEDGLISDGRAAAAWLARRQAESAALGNAPRRTVLWGESIGSGVAVAVAAEKANGSLEVPAAMVIEGGFSSCVAMGTAAYPWLPVRLLMHDKFLNSDRAAGLQADLPVLMLHGSQDDIVPIALARELWEALPPAGRCFVEIEGAGHNDLPFHDSSAWLTTVAGFLARVVVRDEVETLNASDQM
eukprot:gene3237-4082_t